MIGKKQKIVMVEMGGRGGRGGKLNGGRSGRGGKLEGGRRHVYGLKIGNNKRGDRLEGKKVREEIVWGTQERRVV